MPTRKKKHSPKKRSKPAADVPQNVITTTETTYISPLARKALPKISWYEVVATGLFSGYLPKAPGTWGSLAAILLFYLSTYLVPQQGVVHWGFLPVSWWALGLGVTTTLVGIAASGRLADEWHEKDPGAIVIDEFAGVFFACLFITPHWYSLAAAFVFFRLFDIWKPGPIATLQDLPGGRGIVLDDVLAGLFAAPLAFIVELIWRKFFNAG